MSIFSCRFARWRYNYNNNKRRPGSGAHIDTTDSRFQFDTINSCHPRIATNEKSTRAQARRKMYHKMQSIWSGQMRRFIQLQHSGFGHPIHTFYVEQHRKRKSNGLLMKCYCCSDGCRWQSRWKSSITKRQSPLSKRMNKRISSVSSHQQLIIPFNKNSKQKRKSEKRQKSGKGGRCGGSMSASEASNSCECCFCKFTAFKKY